MMKIERALKIAKELAIGYRRWGKQLSPPYPQQELIEAIAVLDSNGHFNSDLAEELTKTKRQLNAALAREAGLKKRLGVVD